MRDREVLKFLDDGIAAEQRVILGGHRERLWRQFARQLRQVGQNAERLHVAFKIPQFVVDLMITMLLGSIDIVEFVQDDIKGLRETVKMNDLLPCSVAAALDPEIRVDQKQGFRGQIVQLQIPSRVIRGNVPDHRHVEAIETKVGIVVMQIRDAFLFTLLAAIFADVVSGCRAGYQS